MAKQNWRGFLEGNYEKSQTKNMSAMWREAE
jgi:hypothetical protein